MFLEAFLWWVMSFSGAQSLTIIKRPEKSRPTRREKGLQNLKYAGASGKLLWFFPFKERTVPDNTMKEVPNKRSVT